MPMLLKKLFYPIFILFFSTYCKQSFSNENYLFCTKIDGVDVTSNWVRFKDGNYKTVSGYWIKPNIFKSDETINNLKKDCSRVFSNTNPNQINVSIKNRNLSWQHTIIDSDDNSITDITKMSSLNYKDVLDYRFLLALAYISRFAYRTESAQQEANSYDLDSIFNRTGYKIIPYSVFKTKKANIHSVAFINHTDKVIILGYKGTSNQIDREIDTLLMGSNLFKFQKFKQAIDEALQIHKDTVKLVKNIFPNYKEYKFVLTGHSLGGFYASIVAANKGLPARVFSSPATHFNSGSLFNFFNIFKKFQFDNVINFVRYSDPVNAFSGRHVENRIYFYESNQINILQNHSLTAFINEVFEKKVPPYYYDLKPTYSKVKMPSDSSYFGLKKLISYKGYSSPNMFTNIREKYINLCEKDFNVREEQDDYLIIDVPNQSRIDNKSTCP
ncbi:lipase family protein [Fluviispira multicolorata]|uniref:triacylglycerol lipase n=1 Tax=Fluviispira multicolorata TaxID=2654512 RepID=A0A833JFE9_9BACT|nr:hypothetical protein [Fluviispira multicolorata]KAB8033675.1 hypothetical protein GCL57_02920 [Fluviispira multicolorata]